MPASNSQPYTSMMKNIYIIFVLVLIIISGCEDFLVKNPADAVVVDQAIESIEDAQVALNGVYATFKATAYYGRYFVAHGR